MYIDLDLVKVERIHTMKNSNYSSPAHLSVSQQLLTSDKAVQTLHCSITMFNRLA